MKKPWILILPVLLSGCGIARRHEQQAQLLLYKNCNPIKKMTAHADCLNDVAAQDTALLPTSPPLQEIIAYANVLAEQVKAKKITNTEANYEFLSKRNEMIAQINTQAAQYSAAHADFSQEVGQSLKQYGQTRYAPPAYQPIYLQANEPQQRQTHCIANGAYMNCTTY